MSGILNPNAPLITAAISVAPLPINTGTLFTMPTGIVTNITATAIPTTKVVTTAPTTGATTTAPTTTKAATTAPTTGATTTAPTTTKAATTAPTTGATTTAPTTTKAATTAPTTGATTAPTTAPTTTISGATTTAPTTIATTASATTGAVTTAGSTVAPPVSVSVSVSTIVAPGVPPIIHLIINDQNVNNNTLISQVVQQQQAIQTALNTTTNTNNTPPPPPPPQTPTLNTTDNFQVIDEAAKTSFHTPGTPFTGTVAGVQNEYINLNPTNLNITAITPNAFIQSGAGNDALQAYQGRNVLDAGAGSNTVIAGTGQDTILASVSSATTLNTTPITDLIKNFGAGDDAILRGLTPADFNIKFTDSTGAFGPELLLTATSNTTGGPTATAALAGFSTGDVASGRLAISFSTDPAGQPFLLIHANS